VVRTLKNYLYKQTFNPSFLGVFINPYYIIRRGLFRGIVSHATYLKGKMLDFGCGKKPYKDLFSVDEYIGLDIEESGHSHRNEQIDIFYDGKTIPFGDNFFDSVFSSEVFEHIFNVDEIIPELHRVMKPGGYLLITLPFVWAEHEIPYDFARYTSFGIEHLLQKWGFEVIKIEKTTNYVETVFQMWNAYMYEVVLPTNLFFRAIMIPLCVAPVTIIGMVLSRMLPQNKNFYHNTIVLAQKKL